MESKEKIAEGRSFPFAEKESRRKKLFLMKESTEKVAEGKGFPFEERKSRRKKKLFPKNGVKREGSRRKRFFLCREG